MQWLKNLFMPKTVPTPTPRPENVSTASSVNLSVMRTSNVGIAMIKHFEGVRNTAYKDSVGIWTIGVGHTSAAGEPAVKPGMTITDAEVDEILKRDLRKFEQAVARNVRVKLTQGQFDALVSFTFNLGEGNLKSSKLLDLLNQGRYDLVPEQFLRWNKAGGKVLAGLTTRRQAEADLFANGKYVK